MRRSVQRAGGIVLAIVLLLGAVAVLVGILTAASGYDAFQALGALWRGSLGTPYAIFSATLVRATPLILTGLAVALAFTGGVMNIGAEGQLLMGASAATAVGLGLGQPLPGWIALPVALLCGVSAGAAWALVPAWLRRRFGVLEVITTIMMNFVALYLVGYLVRGPLQEPLRIYPQSQALPESARLPPFTTGTRLHWGFALAIACAGLAWWMLRFTAAGFRLRVLGRNTEAARVTGLIDVGRSTTRVFLLSGGLAGLAGAIEVTGVTYSLYENLSPGYGYTAIAVALVGSLDPVLVAVSGMFFGALEAGAAAMQRDAGVPAVLAAVVEASIILLLIAIAAFRTPGTRLRQVREARAAIRADRHAAESS